MYVDLPVPVSERT